MFSCGKYRLLCATISIAIETFRYVIAWSLDYNDLNRLFLYLSVSHLLQLYNAFGFLSIIFVAFRDRIMYNTGMGAA